MSNRSDAVISWYNNAENPIWVSPHEDTTLKESIVKEFKIHPATAQVLISRGFTSIEQIHKYLYAKLPDLHDPFLMAEMPEAVKRVTKAIKAQENILIYGDNDVDGMTGTALLTEYLRYVGANVFFYVSNRGSQRQSIIVEALEYALKNNCKLLITVDCGITAANEIAQVVEKNIDVIITDHHVPTDKIPNCVATLNPKLFNNPYPNKDLTGVGVAFKLAHGITNQLVSEGYMSPRKVDLKRFLDLVALGTISDMGSLLGENRILVRYGLQQLSKGKRVGLNKLISISDPDLNLSDLSTFTIASKIAPRLNSLGRIDDPTKGVQLLLIRNTAMAEKMAIELDLNNIERQRIERLVANDVEEAITINPALLNDNAVILYSENWHPGVIAIISTRISKYYHRPTIIIAIENGVGKGSIRSIPEFPVLKVLQESSDILMNFGGHDYAAGLTIKVEHIEEFKRRFVKAANEKLQHHDVMNKLALDAEVNFHDITFEFMESLKLLEPYGNENPQPVFFCKAKQAWPPKVIGKSQHLKLYLQQGERMLEGIAFGKAGASPILRRKNLTLLIAFTPQIINFQGPSIQLMIRDFKILEDDLGSSAP
jgi:single-stranded-DNA-specific exonuclease